MTKHSEEPEKQIEAERLKIPMPWVWVIMCTLVGSTYEICTKIDKLEERIAILEVTIAKPNHSAGNYPYQKEPVNYFANSPIAIIQDEEQEYKSPNKY